jgi:hypothetical protein
VILIFVPIPPLMREVASKVALDMTTQEPNMAMITHGSRTYYEKYFVALHVNYLKNDQQMLDACSIPLMSG